MTKLGKCLFMQVVNCLRSSSCCCSVAQLCPTLCNPTDCSTPGFPVLRHLPCPSPYPSSLSFTISWSLLKLISIKLMMPSNHLILCPPAPDHSPSALKMFYEILADSILRLPREVWFGWHLGQVSSNTSFSLSP